MNTAQTAVYQYLLSIGSGDDEAKQSVADIPDHLSGIFQSLDVYLAEKVVPLIDKEIDKARRKVSEAESRLYEAERALEELQDKRTKVQSGAVI